MPSNIFHSKEIPSFENGYSGQNISAWRNKLVDQYLDKLVQEFDKKKQRDYIQTILTEYAEDVPAIPLYFGTSASVFVKELSGYMLTGLDAPASLWAEKWTLSARK